LNRLRRFSKTMAMRTVRQTKPKYPQSVGERSDDRPLVGIMTIPFKE